MPTQSVCTPSPSFDEQHKSFAVIKVFNTCNCRQLLDLKWVIENLGLIFLGKLCISKCYNIVKFKYDISLEYIFFFLI